VPAGNPVAEDEEEERMGEPSAVSPVYQLYVYRGLPPATSTVACPELPPKQGTLSKGPNVATSGTA
jgi:hypothetical protein